MILGIYGNIGVGKSTVAHYLTTNYDFNYLSLDELAKILLAENSELKAELYELQKNNIIDIFDRENEVNFEKVGNYIFLDERKNKLISAIIWKYLKMVVEEKILALKNDDLNLVVEGAILPAMQLANIDVYLYIVNPLISHRWPINYWKKIIAKERQRSLREINSVIKIQNDYNFHQPIDYLVENNPRKMTKRDLFNKIDELMVMLKKAK